MFCSEARTGAGTDQVGGCSEMHRFGSHGERQLVLRIAGHLGTTQAVSARVERAIDTGESVRLDTVVQMVEAAAYLGGVSVTHQRRTKVKRRVSRRAPSAAVRSAARRGRSISTWQSAPG